MRDTKHCIIFNEKKGLIEVPKDAFLDTYINHDILISNDSKCCATHLTKNNVFYPKCINDIEVVSNNSTLSGKDIKLLLDSLRHSANNTLFKNFSKTDQMSDNDIKSLTASSGNDFNILLNSMKTLKNSPNRNKSQALGTYLFWLRTGLDYRTIATLLSLDNHQTVGEYCEQARNSLLKDFVPKNLGVSHITRDQWAQQKTVKSTELFNVDPDQLVLIADGTYLYTNKCFDNEIQRSSFSVQKKKPLAKPFVICSANGKIVNIYGLFPAKKMMPQ